MPIDLGKFERGAISKTTIVPFEILDGTPVPIPVTIMRGRQSGPTLYIGAAIHGDEVTGIEVMRRVIMAVNPHDLRGNIIFVPVQNTLAFRERQRFFPGHSIEGFWVDASTAFPGSPDGEMASVLAHHLLNDLILAADFAIDFHAPLHGGRYIDHALVPDPRFDPDRAGFDLAKVFGPEIIVINKVAKNGGPTALREVANSEGVPTITVEFEVGGLVTEPSVTHGVTGVLNVLRSFDMIDGEVQPPKNQIIAQDTLYARARKGGLAEITCELGQQVREGDVLGRIYNLWFELVEEVRSPCDGIVYRLAMPRPIHGTERIAGIVVPSNASESVAAK